MQRLEQTRASAHSWENNPDTTFSKYVFYSQAISIKYSYQFANIKYFVFPVKIFDLIAIGINLTGMKEIDWFGHLLFCKHEINRKMSDFLLDTGLRSHVVSVVVDVVATSYHNY